MNVNIFAPQIHFALKYLPIKGSAKCISCELFFWPVTKNIFFLYKLIATKELLNNIEGALTKVHGVALSAFTYLYSVSILEWDPPRNFFPVRTMVKPYIYR